MTRFLLLTLLCGMSLAGCAGAPPTALSPPSGQAPAPALEAEREALLAACQGALREAQARYHPSLLPRVTDMAIARTSPTERRVRLQYRTPTANGDAGNEISIYLRWYDRGWVVEEWQAITIRDGHYVRGGVAQIPGL